MKVLKLLLVIQFALGMIWTIPITTTEEPGLGVFLLFVWTAPFSLACMLIAAIHFYKHPETRRLASLVVALPVAVLFVPFLIRGVAGGAIINAPDPVAATTLAVLLLPVAICLFLPHEVARFVPTCILRCRWFNITVLVLLALLLLPWLAVLAVFATSQPFTLEEHERLAVFAAGYGLFCFVASPFVFIGSYVSLFQRRDRALQWLRAGQLGLSAVLWIPATISVAVTFLVLAAATAG